MRMFYSSEVLDREIRSQYLIRESNFKTVQTQTINFDIRNMVSPY